MYGPTVYDEGLHGGHRDPGFLKAVMEASDNAPELFSNELTLKNYRELHRLAMLPFESQPKKTNLLLEQPDPSGPRTVRVRESMAESQLKSMTDANGIVDVNLRKAFENVKKLSTVVANKYNNGDEIAEITMWPTEDGLEITYPPRAENLSNIVEKIFTAFNQSSKSLENIDQLYRELELLHYFTDGNTRTNLILVNWLLAREEMNPVILQSPSLSIFLSEEQSRELLQRGMDEWNKEACEQNEARHVSQEEALKKIQDEKERRQEMMRRALKSCSS